MLKAAVISIPVILLWNVKITLRRKLALWGILCLSIFTAITAIIKIAGGNISHGQVDSAWAIFWFQAEAAIAVVVVSITAFRALFIAHRASKRQSPAQHASSSRSVWSKTMRRHKEWPGAPASSFPGVTTDIQSPYRANSFEASQDMELPLRGPGIFVTQEISSNQVGCVINYELTDLDNSPDSTACGPKILCRKLRVRAASRRMRCHMDRIRDRMCSKMMRDGRINSHISDVLSTKNANIIDTRSSTNRLFLLPSLKTQRQLQPSFDALRYGLPAPNRTPPPLLAAVCTVYLLRVHFFSVTRIYTRQ